MFKQGQKVIILNLYNLEHDGSGEYLCPARDNSNKGKHLVRTDYGDLPVALERIKDADSYWLEKRMARIALQKKD